VGAAFLFSLMSAQVKLAGQTLPVEMLILARTAVTLVMSYATLRAMKLDPWGQNKKLLVLRALFGVGGLECFFFALTRLPLAEATVIHYLNPIFTAVLAALVLRERVGKILALALALSFAGTLLVTRPSFLAGGASLDAIGSAAALGGAVFSACAYVTVRRLTETESPHVIVFYFPLVGLPITAPLALRGWVWPTAGGWLLLLGIGVVTQLAQVLLTKGLALVPAGRATATTYAQILFASLWGILFFSEPPSIYTLAGAALIAVATFTLMRKR
jgi:drug/metabolite transporter (DMT)-like permease